MRNIQNLIIHVESHRGNLVAFPSQPFIAVYCALLFSFYSVTGKLYIQFCICFPPPLPAPITDYSNIVVAHVTFKIRMGHCQCNLRARFKNSLFSLSSLPFLHELKFYFIPELHGRDDSSRKKTEKEGFPSFSCTRSFSLQHPPPSQGNTHPWAVVMSCLPCILPRSERVSLMHTPSTNGSAICCLLASLPL